MSNFRDIARALQPFISDTYDLLGAADAVVQVVGVEAPVYGSHVEYPEQVLLHIASTHEETVAECKNHQKIAAIKALRTFTGSGLVAAKKAVEASPAWQESHSLHLLREKLVGNPWDMPKSYEYDENHYESDPF